MSQPTYFKGKDLFVYVNGIAVGCDKTATFEITTKTFDNSSKCTVDSAGNLYQSNIPISSAYKVTGNGLTVIDTGPSAVNEQSTHRLMALQLAQTKVFVSWIRGTDFYGFDGYITSMKETANFEELSTYDYEIMSAGPIIPVNPS